MLQNVFLSRKASDVVAEFLVLALVAMFIAKFFAILLVPLGLALIAIPALTLTWLPTSKGSKKFVAVVLAAATFTEIWTYFLFQVVHKIHFGHSFSGLPL